MAILELIGAIAIPIGRSVFGWLQNALEDGQINDFEWKQLGSTIFSIGVPAIALYFSFNAVGLDFSAIGAACGGLLVDMILKAIKKKK